MYFDQNPKKIPVLVKIWPVKCTHDKLTHYHNVKLKYLLRSINVLNLNSVTFSHGELFKKNDDF